MRRALVLVVLVAGCVDEPELGESDEAIVVSNGDTLNGTRLNGTTVNGTRLNGVRLNGTRLNGTRLNGTTLDGTTLTGTTGAAPTAGATAVGATWTVNFPASSTQTATTFSLRIDSAEAGTGASSDLWFYAVSYQTDAGWQPLCGAAGATPIQALAVTGVWKAAGSDSAHYSASTTEFTWACRGNSIAKCVEMGYKPWRGYLNHLQSCVRLLRGDYCGTGTPYTVDGTLLNLYDNVGVQLDTESWKPEAAWGPAGPVCVNKSNAARYNLVMASDPKCVKAKLTTTCGTSFISGAYLIDELP